MSSTRRALVFAVSTTLIGLGTPADARVARTTVLAQSLVANRLGESPSRTVHVVLPPGYDEAGDRRYPVLYLLHAWGTGPESWLGRGAYEGLDLPRALRAAIDAGRVGPMILVLPDATTRFGGSWYVNSATGGAWEDFLAEEVVAHVDGAFRTLPDRVARGIAGQSMGGYGALRIAMNRPGTFGAVLGMSAPNLVEPNPFGEEAVRGAVRLESDAGATAFPLARVLWSKAVAFSPVPGRAPYHAELPWSVVEDRVVSSPPVWERWLESALVRQVPRRAADLRRLAIRLEVGDRDPLLGESQTLAAALSAADVPHELVVFDGDHVRGIRARFEVGVLEFFDRAFRVTPTPAGAPAEPEPVAPSGS